MEALEQEEVQGVFGLLALAAAEKQNMAPTSERAEVNEFKCKVCNKTFAQKGGLKQHSVVHSDFRPFQCGKCNRTFKQRSVLKAHKQVKHSGADAEKPHKCPHCQYSNWKSGNLKRHIMSHTKKKISKMGGNPEITSTATPVVTVFHDNAPTTASSLGRGPSVATGQHNGLAPFQAMSPATLNTLLTAAPPNNCQVINRQYILIDTRDSANSNQGRVKSDHVARFPIIAKESVAQSKEFRFGTRGAVVKYILENEANLLDVLQAPGFYNCIVVMDEDGSTSSSKLRSLMNALSKWNESTRTGIYLLEGGVQAFCNEYSDQLISGTMTPPVMELATTDSTISSPEDCLRNFDAMIVTSKILIQLASNLKSLSSVLSILGASELEIRRDRVIPKSLLCPACLKYLSGEILFCGKGHSFCSGCYSRMVLKICGQPQCGAPISGNCRNWALEQTLAVGMTYPCVCDQDVKLDQSETHFEECVRNVKEFGKIQEMISVLHQQLREEYGKLGAMKKAAMDYDLTYTPTLFLTAFPEGMDAVEWNWHMDRSVKEKTVAALREELLSLAVNTDNN